MTTAGRQGGSARVAGDWLLAPATQAVFGALRAAGYEGRAVGGVVRNSLLGLPVTDVDIATPAAPEAVLAAARAAGLRAVPTGIEHGTVTVVSGGEGFEVTTLRRDVETDGRRAVVAFTEDWAEDARRRDFTLNALYCDAEGVVHDPLGGIADLMARRVRFIGEPDQRIREDYLRILRFFRVHAMYGEGDLDRDGLLACERQRDGLARLSAERVQGEVLRLLAAAGVLAAIDAMQAHGLLAILLGVAPRPGVLRRLIATADVMAMEADPVLRLSALAAAVDEDKARLAARLKLSNADRQALLTIDAHGAAEIATVDAAAARRRLYRVGAMAFERQVLAAASVLPGATMALRALLALAHNWPIPRFPVSGRDLMALGITPGPDMGRILGALEAWWIDADFPDAAVVRSRLATVADEWKAR